MANFQWDTEDDDNWDNVEQAPAAPARSWRLLLIPLGIVTLLAAGGFAVYSRINNTVNKVTAQTESEVRATVQLMYERAAAGDTELFGATLSGRDREWSAAQQWMMGGAGLLDRSPFELTLLEDVPQVVGVELSPGLDSAEITTTVHYQTTLSETVQYNLPVVFRKGNNLWLYAPPADDYWGEVTQETISGVAVTFPERDRNIVVRIVSDLALGFTALCTQNASLCELSTGFPAPLVFSRNAQSLADLKPFSLDETTDLHSELPTPSLVGLPTDNASYDALLAGYATLLFSGGIARSASYDCCANRLYASSFIERMLIDAGLKQEVLSAEIHAALFDTVVNLDEPIGWARSTNINPEEQQNAQLVTRFAAHELEIDLAAGLTNLMQYSDFQNWAIKLMSDATLSRLSIDPQDSNSLSAYSRGATFRAAFGRYMSKSADLIQPRDQLNPPIPYPNSIVGLTCQDQAGGSFVRWDVAANHFETVYEAPNLNLGWAAYHEPSRGFVFEQRAKVSAEFTDPSIVLLNEAGASIIPTFGKSFSGISGANEEYLLLTDSNSSGFTTSAVTVDPLQCDQQNCPQIEYAGRPMFSPDKSKVLIVPAQMPYQFIVLDANNQPIFEKPVALESTFNVFWVSDSSIAYRQSFDSPLLEVNLLTGEETPLLTLDMIATWLDRPEIRDAAWVSYWGNSNSIDEIFASVQMGSQPMGEQIALIVNVALQEVTFVDDMLSSLSAFSGTDRYLFGWQQLPNFTSRSAFVDRETQKKMFLPLHSNRFPVKLSDGWFLQPSEAYTLLIAPEHDYYEFVALPEEMTCAFATSYPD